MLESLKDLVNFSKFPQNFFTFCTKSLNAAQSDHCALTGNIFIAGNKKEKQGSEILTMLLQALKNTVRSNSLPVQKILVSSAGKAFLGVEFGLWFSCASKTYWTHSTWIFSYFFN